MKNKTKDDMILELFHPLFSSPAPTIKSVDDYSIEELEEIIKTKKRANFNHWLSNQVAEFAKKHSLTNQCITLIDEEEIEKLYNLYSEEEDYAYERLEFVLKQALNKIKSAEQMAELIKIEDAIMAYCKKYLNYSPDLNAHSIEEYLRELAAEAEDIFTLEEDA
jgi:hypothetical protein